MPVGERVAVAKARDVQAGIWTVPTGATDGFVYELWTRTGRDRLFRHAVISKVRSGKDDLPKIRWKDGQLYLSADHARANNFSNHFSIHDSVDKRYTSGGTVLDLNPAD